EARYVAHHETLGIDAARFAILGVHAGIADMRIRQGDDLPAIRGVGEDLLVAGDGGVEDHLAHRSASGPDGTAAKDRPVGKDQRGGFEISHICNACEKRETPWVSPASLKEGL